MSVGIIFPGQGSQHPGMGRFLYDNFKSTQRLFEEASDAIRVNFKKLCFDSDEATLSLTINTQPCLLLTSIASFEALKESFDFNCAVTAGHSVGEYASMVAANVISFSDGMRAVRKRGESMQSAVPLGEGGMLAVMGLTADQVKTLCQWCEEKSGASPVEPANFNAPGQIVISGNQHALSWLQQNFSKEIFDPAPSKVRLIPLKVSAPFHCSMMSDAEKTMRDVLSAMSFRQPTFPIVQNVSATTSDDIDQIRTWLIEQVSRPVRWVECIQTMTQFYPAPLIECGPGKVLSGLAKKIDAQTVVYNLNSLEELKYIETQLKG